VPGDEAVPVPGEAGGDPGDHRDEDHPQVQQTALQCHRYLILNR
jgi:hypothetical protein